MFTGKEIKDKRHALGWSAKKLADFLKTSKENIYKWEGGTKPSSQEDREDIENWLNDVNYTTPIKEMNNADWRNKYEDLQKEYNAILKKYIALLEKITT